MLSSFRYWRRYRVPFIACLLFAGISLLFTLPSVHALAQKKPGSDTAGKLTINILHNKTFIYQKTDSGDIDKIIGEVVLMQGADTMYCDSTYLNIKTNNLEAFGDVKIVQLGGTEAQSDYLRYTSNKKLAYMRGNVSLTDGKNKLWCEELNYDLGTKIGTYDKNGTLQADTTTVSSIGGVYNVNTKDVHFTGNVIVTDPKYTVTSEDMMYNTESKVVTFYPPRISVVVSGKSILHTTDGVYDSKNEIAHFKARSSVLNDDQYIEADTINYNHVTGYGNATGQVINIDTTQHTTLYCGHEEYYEKSKRIWATIRPVLKQINGTDSLFIRADTFYSAPIPKKADPVLTAATAKKSIGKSEKQKLKADTAVASSDTATDNSIAASDSVALADTAPVIKPIVKNTIAPQIVKPKTKRQLSDSMAITSPLKDTSVADSTAPRYYSGYRHVLIFSDSLQGKCDSISYTQSDSVLRMMRDPIAWSHESQITGDTILLHLDSGKIKTLYVPNNALIVSQSGPVKAHLYNQVQGKTLTGYFVNNAIEHMVVVPSAECIYYPKDDHNAYIGVDQAQSEKMILLFRNQQILRILCVQEFKQTTTPMDKADLPNMKLSRFKWLVAEKPKSIKELFQ